MTRGPNSGRTSSLARSLQRGLDEPREQRVRAVRSRLELRMSLRRDVVRVNVLRQFDELDEPELGGAAANAGPSADEATLAGAKLAEERSWTAPPMPDAGPDRPTEATELPGGPS